MDQRRRHPLRIFPDRRPAPDSHGGHRVNIDSTCIRTPVVAAERHSLRRNDQHCRGRLVHDARRSSDDRIRRGYRLGRRRDRPWDRNQHAVLRIDGPVRDLLHAPIRDHESRKYCTHAPDRRIDDDPVPHAAAVQSRLGVRDRDRHRVPDDGVWKPDREDMVSQPPGCDCRIPCRIERVRTVCSSAVLVGGDAVFQLARPPNRFGDDRNRRHHHQSRFPERRAGCRASPHR